MGEGLPRLVMAPRWLALLGFVPIVLGIKEWRELRKRPSDSGEGNAGRRDEIERERVRRGAGLWTVATVTAANGGDNLGVYVPLFAGRADTVAIFAAVFALGTAVWCWVGYTLAGQPTVGRLLRRHGERALPWVLGGIGMYVLADFWRP